MFLQFCNAFLAEELQKVRNYLPLTEKQKKLYKNPDNDIRGLWQSVSLLAQGYRPNQMYEIVAPIGKKHTPPAGNCWKIIESEFIKALTDNRIYFGSDGKGVPRRKQFLSESKGLVPWSWWPHDEAGHTDEAKKEINNLFGANNPFDTPKPERLIHRILYIATNKDDLVLDSFLGSGTTAAVAHKMGRRYIGVEMGEHAKTHCAERLKKVIDGEQGGISKTVDWNGGGGFRFFTLGDEIFDSENHIKSGITFENLAAHIYFTETKTPMRKQKKKSAFLGVHNGKAYALLYNGVLGDKSETGGNILTHKTLNIIMNEIDAAENKNKKPFEYESLVIYGEATKKPYVSLQENNIEFKQTPYDIKVW